ncbi:TauD/TfdA family dioxygenase [Nocardioides bruguierae]|uniref:TauD/TfdA family dioxygenase n=1 Tax=Nocardioides bruguierae TaxID=2945102 RepID=A0A9X2DB00_9ACTN|nr:TauD/TfdA family dioxygenase [Nocardioides bruguierae]MCM0622618.1 TauD/TfdA family dioxygenase [Nocardioides bruguierae]
MGPADWKRTELTDMKSATWNAQTLGASTDSWTIAVPDGDLRNVDVDTISDLLYDGPGVVLMTGVSVLSEGAAAASLVALGERVGTPMTQTLAGDLITRVEARELHVPGTIQRGHRSNAELAFHCDRTDLIALLCVREAQQGGDSLLVSSRALFDVLADEDPAALGELQGSFPQDRRDEEGSGEAPWFSAPIFWTWQDRVYCRYIRKFIESSQRHEDAPRLTPEQTRALDVFDALLQRPELVYTMRLAPGDLQIIENHTVLHSRTAFTDTPGAGGRLLMRLWLSHDRSPELPEAYRPIYGTCAAGAVRGAMSARTVPAR